MEIDVAVLIGRILFGGYFAMAGFNHFKSKEAMQGYASAKGVSPWQVSLAGLLLLLGGLGIVLGAYVQLSVVVLFLLLLLIAFKMHAFWKHTDPQEKMMDQTHFMKTIAMAGALLMILGMSLPWEYALNLAL